MDDLEAMKQLAVGLTPDDLRALRTWIDSRLAAATHSGTEDDLLSERETEVLRLLALGYGNKQIATSLKLSVKSVETYKTRALEKLGIRTRVDIVQYALRRGWLLLTPSDPGPLEPPSD